MASIKPVKLNFKVTEPLVKKSKSDIILLHGLACSKEEFDDIANDLANETGRRLYALDARNHGDSEHSNIYNFDAMIADVINFMDEQNIKSATIFGHSMGGKTAMGLALAHPERVENIIVEDMSPKALPKDLIDIVYNMLKLSYDAIKVVPPEADLQTAMMNVFGYIVSTKPADLMPNVEVLKTAKTCPYPLPIEKKNGKYVWKTNFPVILKELENVELGSNLQGLYKKPALFLYGTNSEFNVHNDKDFILKLFPKAQMHGLPTSHMVHGESPKEFVLAVKNFLE